jgi:predicted enzyme related to lactoylglutathione lyase
MAVQSVMPNLYSADVDRAVAFYRDLFGADGRPSDGARGGLRLGR